MRPIYETNEDLSRERAVVAVVESRWRCNCAKLPLRYELDYAVYQDGKLKCYLEIKCRDVDSTRYKTLILSAAKVATAKQLSDTAGVPAIFVCRFKDCTKWFALSDLVPFYQHGGRTDRGDTQDTEPVAHFAIERMSTLEQRRAD